MTRQEHWNQVYLTKAPDEVSWHQTTPATSLQLIEAAGIAKDQGVIDVGGGVSVLVDCLLDAGFVRPAVLDISAAALAHARQRLGARADSVDWVVADVTEFTSGRQFALWHDRAVFHFLTALADRRKYVAAMQRALLPAGHVIIGTFALDGPAKCSGLDVVRYDAAAIAAELGAEFQLRGQRDETHVTPWSTEQRFSFFHFTRVA